MTNVAPDYSKSVEFLCWFRPGGPWTLTAIHPDKKSISTQTFSETSVLRSWLEKEGARKNIYFNVNPLLGNVQKKASREDVAALAWLHVDLDPHVGEDLGAERTRILDLLRSPPAPTPPPTCIVFSGGGYQGFWRLRAPLQLGGQLPLCEEAKLYNLQLEVVLGGDNCHNVDRIMRLPGTVNRPDERKRAKGRTEELACVVDFDLERTYDLATFTRAPLTQGSSGEGFAGSSIKVSGNVKRFVTVEEISPNLGPNARVTIVQGLDPDNPHKHPGRSEWLFWVCCEMVRAGCDDDTIFGVITDPEFLISQSVLDKGSRSERYALRQIERAREEAVDPWLRKLNEQHAVIGDVGGRCRIISEVVDKEFNRARISYQSFGDFKNRYCNKRIEWPGQNGKMSSTAVSEWWIHHPQRREYNTVTFAPGREVPGSYNLWKGFAVDALPGDCSLFLQHVRDNICSNVKEYYTYLLNWMAWAVQHPDSAGQVAVVLRGVQGTGKGVFAKTFGNLFGRHFVHVANSKHLVGNFNRHLQDCCVLFADEAFYAGDKKNEPVLKMLVTEDSIPVESKGIDVESCPNFLHVILASNEKWIVPAGLEERRFFVLDVAADRMQDSAYFAAIQRQMKSGGSEALLHLLMTMDLSKFEVRSQPKTEALREQKIYSFTSEEEWWYKKLKAGEMYEGMPWPVHTFASTLTHDFIMHVRQWSSNDKSSSTRLGYFMRSVFPKGSKRRGRLSGEHVVTLEDGSVRQVVRPWVYLMPTLAESREHWDKNFGGPFEWENEEDFAETKSSSEADSAIF